jgi:hypothetical protein
VREDNFFCGGSWVGFCENVGAKRVFGWRERGGLRGKRGELALTFVVAKDAPGFSTLF